MAWVVAGGACANIASIPDGEADAGAGRRPPHPFHGSSPVAADRPRMVQLRLVAAVGESRRELHEPRIVRSGSEPRGRARREGRRRPVGIGHRTAARRHRAARVQSTSNAEGAAGWPLPRSRIVSSSRIVGSRQSQWSAKHGGVFKTARKSVKTDPFASHGSPALHVNLLSRSWMPPASSFFSQESPVSSSRTTPLPKSVYARRMPDRSPDAPYLTPWPVFSDRAGALVEPRRTARTEYPFVLSELSSGSPR